MTKIATEHLIHDAPQIFNESGYGIGKMLSLFGRRSYYAPSIDRKFYTGSKPPHFLLLQPDEEVTKECFFAGINIYPRFSNSSANINNRPSGLFGAKLLHDKIYEGKAAIIDKKVEYEFSSKHESRSTLYMSCKSHPRCNKWAKNIGTWCKVRGREIFTEELFHIMSRVYTILKEIDFCTGIIMTDEKRPFHVSLERMTNLVKNGFMILQDYFLACWCNNYADFDGGTEKKPDRLEIL